MPQNTILGSLLVALTCSVSSPAQAQDYPHHAIRWVVPFLAGTAPDNTVRIVADAMGGILKQAVIVDNKGGVAGNLGAQMVARAPADGYTWVYSATPMAASMRMYKNPALTRSRISRTWAASRSRTSPCWCTPTRASSPSRS